MAIHLTSPLSDLPGIGQKALVDLRALGMRSVRDLLWYLPFRYDDFSRICGAGQVKAGDTVTVMGTLQSLTSRPAKKRGLKIIEGMIADETGKLSVIWFNQSYLEKSLSVGMKLSLAGRVDNRMGLSLLNPVIERSAHTGTHTGRIVPIYGLTGTLTMRRLRDGMKAALPAADEYSDWVPAKIIESEGYPSLAQALRDIHFPSSKQDLESAISRLKFDELFLHQLLFARVRSERSQKSALPIPFDESFLKAFVQSLPFNLTIAQRKAIWEIVQDLEKDHPMNRLLEGDVGSGKTVVAAAAAASVLHAGERVVYLAPTEILASQQQAALMRLLNEPVGLLTRTQHKVGMEPIAKETLISQINMGQVKCVVGTHALLQDQVNFSDVRLVIVDEQHRFGVEQRHALLQTEGLAPHLLSMTATPIPRSLALTIYGDLDLSILNQMPEGRKPVATAVVLESQRRGMWSHVHEQIKQGQQVFVVCPLIDPSDTLGVKSVTEVAKELKNGPLKTVSSATLHGRLKSDEKEKIITAFRDGEIDLLVSTTVVEVGVDIPNANVMVIIGAERFGLAQLHQLRGRVGRSDIQSYCYLLPEQLSGTTEMRLRAMEQTTDGFKLAQKDLELRGAGNVFGNAQSGFPDFQLATIQDTDIMKKARDKADELLGEDPSLKQHSLILEKIDRSFEEVHLE
ncbi:ATP-dependent DNA helicase RecG [Candidatus Uhrbacteria bacterium]|nr:ATP-dependent DNA helicase RecG [Candidatus Uhrbacteria bacterium]